MSLKNSYIAIMVAIFGVSCSTVSTYKGKEFQDKNQLIKYKQLEAEYGENLEKNSILEAIPTSNLNKLKSLLDANVNINQVDSEGNNSLMRLINSFAENKKNTANLLIENGINLRHKNKKKQTALSYAVNEGCNTNVDNIEKESIFEILIEAKFDLDEKDINGNTALISATNPECWLEKHTRYFVQNLLLKGADVNAQNSEGDTPLINAIKRRLTIKNAGKNHPMVFHFSGMLSDNKKSINVLIESGADKSIKNNEGNSALMLAKKLEEKDILDKLKE